MSGKLVVKEPSIFFSYLDEENFFRWLAAIPAVKGVVRVGPALEVAIDEPIDEASLRDLIALLRRYGVDMKVLKDLVNPDNEAWFRSPVAYWFDSVFGG